MPNAPPPAFAKQADEDAGFCSGGASHVVCAARRRAIAMIIIKVVVIEICQDLFYHRWCYGFRSRNSRVSGFISMLSTEDLLVRSIFPSAPHDEMIPTQTKGGPVGNLRTSTSKESPHAFRVATSKL
jgi:hypothetical protein